MFEAADSLAQYWERRAARFAREKKGLAAVCSYGMPEFYNRATELCQQSALRPWLSQIRDADVLEIGCGVGRWTERLAANGNRVTAIDLSPTMVDETRRRLERQGHVAELSVADVTRFDVGRKFDAALSVTVIQHVTDDRDFAGAFERIAGHLRPGGQLILLEAAPSGENARCDSPIFRARSEDTYVRCLESSGFRIDAIRGVDPMPFKPWVLPYLNAMPRPLAVAAMAMTTALSLPLDLLLAGPLTRRSWHKLIVASRPGQVCSAA